MPIHNTGMSVTSNSFTPASNTHVAIVFKYRALNQAYPWHYLSA